MTALREEVRRALHIYMSRSGLTLPQLAERVGYSPYSLRQFSSGARYGDGDGTLTSEALLAWMKTNPIAVAELPGILHPTRATREMDAMLEHVRKGGWGVLYGASGVQKSFLLTFRAAEAAQDPEPGIVYIRSSAAGMTPNVLLRRIAAGIGAPFAQYLDGVRQSVLYTIQRRRSSVALVLDEADALYRWVETLETVRELGDLARARPGRAGVGILVVGNERIMEIFGDRRGVSLVKWRGRVQQQELRVVGPSREEAAGILTAELGELKEKTVRLVLEGCVEIDPVSRKEYINMHRLYNAIRKMVARRGGNGNGQVN